MSLSCGYCRRGQLCRHSHGADLLDQLRRDFRAQLLSLRRLLRRLGCGVQITLADQHRIGRQIAGGGDEVVDQDVIRLRDRPGHKLLAVADLRRSAPGGYDHCHQARRDGGQFAPKCRRALGCFAGAGERQVVLRVVTVYVSLHDLSRLCWLSLVSTAPARTEA